MRTGREFLESLRDGRAVYLDGERVTDVTSHPAFGEQIRQVATMYDLARERWDPDTTTYVEPATGRRTSAMWLIPRSAADLALRRHIPCVVGVFVRRHGTHSRLGCFDPRGVRRHPRRLRAGR